MRQAYRWPDLITPTDTPPEFPAWIVEAIENGFLKISDGYGDVEGRTLRPGDWIVHGAGSTIWLVVDDVTYRALTAPSSDTPDTSDTAPTPPPDIRPSAEPVFGPPFSSGVLARSHRARALQGMPDPPPPEPDPPADPHNAAVEGSSVP